MARILLLLSMTLSICRGGYAQSLLNEPEGVAYDSVHNRYLVSNWVDGNIIAIDRVSGEQSIFAGGLGHCEHMQISGDTVWLATNTRIRALDLETGYEHFSVPITDTPYGTRDVALDGQGFVYAVNLDNAKIYKIDVHAQAYTIFVSGNMVLPISIECDRANNRLVVPSMKSDSIYAVSLEDSTVSVITTDGLPGHEGICRDTFGNWYIMTFSGAYDLHSVYKYDPDFETPPDYIAGGFPGISDICYNPVYDELAVCAAWSDSLTYIPMHSRVNLGTFTFDDGEYGDGDGIPEAGERAKLFVDMKNVGNKPVNNLWLTISFDDASIILVDAESDYGNLLPGQMASNSFDPFVIEIPSVYRPRIGSLFLQATWDTESESDEAEFTCSIHVGGCDILIVDDDGNGLETYYQDALSALHIPSITGAGADVIADSVLNNYEVVIWYTGYGAGDFLGLAARTAIEGYLDSGGKLYITGQGIAADLSGSDPDFLSTYLKCEYLSSSFLPILPVSPESQIFAQGDTIIIYGGDGAGNQSHPDQIAAINGGTGELIYAGSSDYGAVSFDGSYKLVFFSFGFEGIPDDNSRFMRRLDVMHDILDFFDYQFPGTPPTVSDLSISPGDDSHLIDHTPDISWIYYDDNSQNQHYLQVQVGTDRDWGLAEMWNSGPVAGDVPQAIYGGDELLDGQRYYIRVRSQNASIWSNWVEGQMRMNSVPVPAGLVPSGSDSTTELQPHLCHLPVHDAEGDDITYSYELYADADMTQLIEAAADIPPSPGDSMCWQVTAVLAVGEDYYWRARCSDAWEDGHWSEPASFITAPAYVCGDANGDGRADVADAVFIINHVFKHGPAPEPSDAGDANCDDSVNVGDAIYLINYVFRDGPAPVETCCP